MENTQIANNTSIVNTTAITIKKDNLENMFLKLKYNKRKAKFNYQAGVLSGFILSIIQLIAPVMKKEIKTKKDEEAIKKLSKTFFVYAEALTKHCDWKRADLEYLIKNSSARYLKVRQKYHHIDQVIFDISGIWSVCHCRVYCDLFFVHVIPCRDSTSPFCQRLIFRLSKTLIVCQKG